ERSVEGIDRVPRGAVVQQVASQILEGRSEGERTPGTLAEVDGKQEIRDGSLREPSHVCVAGGDRRDVRITSSTRLRKVKNRRDNLVVVDCHREPHGLGVDPYVVREQWQQ